MKIATAQYEMTPDIKANGLQIRELIKLAHDQGAKLVLFPEGSLSGYIKTQIKSWSDVNWAILRGELDEISACCAEFNIYAIVGSAHRLGDRFGEDNRPHNSLYVISDKGVLVTRYDKRMLSNTEINDWYSPGFEPVFFSIGDYIFGCMICIETSFPELFAEYERLGVDCVLFASYGFGAIGQTLIRAHAATNCVWICAAVPSQCASDGASGIVGPDGAWIARNDVDLKASLSVSEIDRATPQYDIALTKARPWRMKAREGEIYRRSQAEHPRSLDRTRF